MKSIFFAIIFLGAAGIVLQAQNLRADSLKQLLEKTPKDTNYVKLLTEIGSAYIFMKPDTALVYAKRALDMARDLHYTNGIMGTLTGNGELLRMLGDYPGSLKMQFEALDMYRKVKDTSSEAGTLAFIGITYMDFREYTQALQYLLQANLTYQQLPVDPMSIFILSNIGNTYDLLGMPDSALYYQKQAQEKMKGIRHGALSGLIQIGLGNIYKEMGKTDSALQYYHQGLLNASIITENINLSKVQQKIAGIYESQHMYDSAMYYARRAFAQARYTAQKPDIMESGMLLFKLHRELNNADSAFLYEDIVAAMKDSLYGPQKFRQLQLLMLDEQQRQQKIIQDQEHYRNKIKYTALLSSLGVLLVLGFILLINNRHKQKAKNEIEKAYAELKATQAQLIQSEKMASLGELTAGIAHEIQNPLNFVNNFSEVNKELLIEIKVEIDKGDLEEVKLIVDDVISNEEKISHHGKRADSIVKGMLLHSRANTGKKELTDINALVDECLRLSYHGLRAKDKEFNAEIKTDFDESIGKINIVPQDISRVLLNLFNNAFYAVDEKRAKLNGIFEPNVSVCTKKLDGKVEIHVRDNGGGIPQSIVAKIFQPFFTTKPTGQGTGLGLSLSYDITKAHGGEIKVETKEGEGSEFIIQLPNV